MQRSLAAAAFIALVAAPAGAAEWKPRTYASESTLDLRTTAPGEGDHWFPVWLVVLDDQVYVRLGTRAAGSVRRHTTNPQRRVRHPGPQLHRIKGEAPPQAAQRGARPAGDKEKGS